MAVLGVWTLKGAEFALPQRGVRFGTVQRVGSEVSRCQTASGDLVKGSESVSSLVLLGRLRLQPLLKVLRLVLQV